MILNVADLNVSVPEAGGMAPRCQAYLAKLSCEPDIVIREEAYKLDRWEGLPYEAACYMESGYHFYANLLAFQGVMIHASAISCEGKAYLFSGPSTVGKSTHTRLWQQLYPDTVRVFNDDKPAVRCIDGVWYAYGTPWCGKDGININAKVPLAGICFLKQAPKNRFRRLSVTEAFALCMTQTQRFYKPENITAQLSLMDRLVRDIPVWELENYPDEAAARLSHDALTAAL